MKAQIGKTYAQILHGKCHWVFTLNELPEWNEAEIQIVDVTGNVPAIGQDYVNGAFTTIAKSAAKMLAEKAEILAAARAIRENALDRLTGIRVNDISPTDTASLNAIAIARTDLKNIPACASVVTATDGVTTKAAVMTEWKRIAAALVTAAPAAASAFNGLDIK